MPYLFPSTIPRAVLYAVYQSDFWNLIERYTADCEGFTSQTDPIILFILFHTISMKQQVDCSRTCHVSIEN